METLLWLGYDDLALPFREIAALLRYQPALDARILHGYGSVPRGVQAVVVTVNGLYLPARVPLPQLRRRWALWRKQGLAQREL